jgi:CubicO group peptidase (beta-lactamase class C family)
MENYQQEFDALIKRLEGARDKNGNGLNMASIIVSQGDDYYSHYFRDRKPVDVRSIAKPIVCIALGIAIERGLYFAGQKVGLDTPIWPFLSKYTQIRDPQNEAKWRQVLLIDLLRITLGHDKGLVFSSDVKAQGEANLIDYVVNYPITGEVGKDFVYSNAGTFVISTLVTEYLGKRLDEFVAEHVFTPLGILEYKWKQYGKYCAGCTGLLLQNEDLHKIGKLIIDNGLHNGRQLAPRHWIEEMRTPHVSSPTHRYIPDRAFPKWSYGLNLWICQDGNYYCDGTDGQYMVFIATRAMLITTLVYQADTEPVSNCIGMLK